MSKWIHGRLGRPITSVFCGWLLVSLLLPLALPPASAQGSFDLFQDIVEPTSVVVIDFHNASGYPTGMLGRTFADALSIELSNTRKVEVIKRSQVTDVLEANNLTVPMDYMNQSMVADRLGCEFTISGTVEAVNVSKERDGTFAEVAVSTLVVSTVTKQPINGALVTQKSSPKIGYSGSTDVLVQEALATAAYQTAQRLLDNRLPIATVLTTPRSKEVILKGGSTIGIQAGMELITIRRKTVTGRVRVSSVTPTDAMGVVLEESKGIGAGDKAIPVFQLHKPQHLTRENKEKAGLQIMSLVGLGLLAMLVGTNGGADELKNDMTAQAASLANAFELGHPDGGVLVNWPYMGDRVLAYVIYRTDNPEIPIDIVEGTVTHYVDSTDPVMNGIGRLFSAEVSINPEDGSLESFTKDTSILEPGSTDAGVGLTLTEQSLTADCLNYPLEPGRTYGYFVRTVYLDYDIGGLDDSELSHPDQYRLYLGNPSSVSSHTTVLKPPPLISPVEGQAPDMSGNFRCQRIPGGGIEYWLELSGNDPSFGTPQYRHLVKARLESDETVVANMSLNDITARFASLPPPRIIYWRMGARVTGQPLPKALQNAQMNGLVYSPAAYYFELSSLPPPPPSAIQSIRGGTSGWGIPTKTRPGRSGVLRNRN